MACSEFCIDLATAISCECGVMGRSGPGQTAEQYKREDAWFEKYDAFLKMTTGEGLRERELREERKYEDDVLRRAAAIHARRAREAIAEKLAKYCSAGQGFLYARRRRT